MKDSEVTFTPHQLAYLERTFPNVAYGYTASEAQLRHHHGQQQVVDAVRKKTRGLAKRIETPDDLPKRG